MVVAIPVFALFFQRGAFDSQTTIQTAQALMYYSLGLWGISGAKVVVPVFYAMGDTKTPVCIAIASFILNLVLSLTLMGEVFAGSDAGFLSAAIVVLSHHLAVFSLAHGGLALATSISSTFNFLLLLLILHFRLGGFPWKEFLVSMARNLLNALLMAVPLFFISQSVDWVGPEKNLLMHGAIFLLLLGLGFSFYLVLAFLLRSPEWQVVTQLGGRAKKALL
jgi:putative peptidoglycan lipid II flippase